MKEIVIMFQSGAWIASADSPITLQDQIILFSNQSTRQCLIIFKEKEAFGILGIVIAPESGFALVYRGVPTEFRLSTVVHDSDTHNPTIPPG
jgi:hypothetical protein